MKTSTTEIIFLAELDIKSNKARLFEGSFFVGH